MLGPSSHGTSTRNGTGPIDAARFFPAREIVLDLPSPEGCGANIRPSRPGSEMEVSLI